MKRLGVTILKQPIRLTAALGLVLAVLAWDAKPHHQQWHQLGVPHNVDQVTSIPLSFDQYTFINPREGCEQRDDCDLVSVDFRKEDYELPSLYRGDVTVRGTSFLAGVQTTSPRALEKYSFVQFIQGCMWSSELGKDGKVKRRFNVTRNGGHLNRRSLMLHPNWTVDSNDDEPVYHSYKDLNNRHFLLQWTDPRPDWIPDRQGHLYGERRPTTSYGFITDRPGPAMLAPARKVRTDRGSIKRIPQTAKNSALQFKTCLYKTSDVLPLTRGDLAEFQKPIVCYSWSQSYVFDHKRQKFTSPPVPNSECLRPLSDEEARVQKGLYDAPIAR